MVEKLTITPYDQENDKQIGNPIHVQFNPNTYSITKALTWNGPQPTKPPDENKTEVKYNAPKLTFGGGDSRQLSLELFYDVTENFEKLDSQDVRHLTNQIVMLTRIVKDATQPPVCKLDWGEKPPEGSDFPFVGVVVNLGQRFTLFSSNGVPLRATLTVTFKEFIGLTKAVKEVDPESTTHVVRQGDSLSSIAAEVYRNATQWRLIAEANRIDNVRRLMPGMRLTIPKAG